MLAPPQWGAPQWGGSRSAGARLAAGRRGQVQGAADCWQASAAHLSLPCHHAQAHAIAPVAPGLCRTSSSNVVPRLHLLSAPPHCSPLTARRFTFHTPLHLPPHLLLFSTLLPPVPPSPVPPPAVVCRRIRNPNGFLAGIIKRVRLDGPDRGAGKVDMLPRSVRHRLEDVIAEVGGVGGWVGGWLGGLAIKCGAVVPSLIMC